MYLYYLSFSLLFLFLHTVSLSTALEFIDVSDKIGFNSLTGRLSLGAVADQNADKRNDLLLVNKTGEGGGGEEINYWIT